MTRNLGRIRGAALPGLVLLCAFPLGCWSMPTTGYDSVVAARRPARAAADERTAPGGAGTGMEPRQPVVSGPLEIGVEEAVLLALENNRALSVQRLGPARSATFEDEAAAAFDPALTVSGSTGRGEDSTGAPYESGSVSLGVSMALASGAQLDVSLGEDHGDPAMAGDTDAAHVGLRVAQPLLKGASRAANLASIRRAGLDTRSSEYELRGFAESLVAQVEAAYWDYSLAEREMEIYTESLSLAEQQLRETQDRVDVGAIAATELAAARAEVALRREALVGARGALETVRIRLLRLVNPPGGGSGGAFWERGIVLREEPAVPSLELTPVIRHVETAMRERPDLKAARLAVERGDVEVVSTRNGLLPRLDLFMNLGRSGYSDSFGGAVGGLDGEAYDASAGLTFEVALGNRAARARNERALLTREEAALALDNLAQLAEVDVRTAYVAATTTREQIEATRATREFRQEALRAEQEKFAVGKSTAFLVAQAQNVVVESRIAEVNAVVAFLKSLAELYRLDGSLLSRRGIRAPGLASPGE